MTTVSVIINNYNYGRFLPAAIESALAQTLPELEVIVVDDGSTDDSREIIDRYGSRIRSVLKENGGQASALNAGYSASRGEVVIFLDADDLLAETAAERAIECFRDPDVAKAHWHLRKIDENGVPTGAIWPRGDLSDGDLRDAVIQYGPSGSASPPTSGNAWSRRFLEQVMPISDEYRLCADDYLYALAPAFGTIVRINEPQSYYRVHSSNNYLGRTLEQRIEFGMRVQEQQCRLLADILESRGIKCHPDAWLKGCWFHRLDRVRRAIEGIVANDASIILIDEDLFGAYGSIAGRTCVPFTERNGLYWGPPVDDTAAAEELRRLARNGARYAVIAWPAFWWLESYPILRQLLELDSSSTVGEEVVIFRIDESRIDEGLQRVFED